MRSSAYPLAQAIAEAAAARTDPRLKGDVATQLRLCRHIGALLPVGGLDAASAANCTQLALHWLSVRSRPSTNGSSSSAPDAVAATEQQLHVEALKLLAALAKDSTVSLQQADARQLVAVLRSLCTTTDRPAGPQRARQPAASAAAQLELLCCSADVLAAAPQLAAPSAKQELVASAVELVVLVLDVHTRAAGMEDGAARAVPYLKLLKALQTLLAEAKKDHGCNLGTLIPALQRLLSYGAHCPPRTPPRGPSPAPRIVHDTEAAAAAVAAAGAGPAVPATGAAAAAAAPPAATGSQRAELPTSPAKPVPPPLSQAAGNGTVTPAAAGTGAGPAAGAYVPPHLRRLSGNSVDSGAAAAAAGCSGHQPAMAGQQAAAAAAGTQNRVPTPDGRGSSSQPAAPPGSPAGRQQQGRSGAGSPQRGGSRRQSRRSSGIDSSDSEVSDSEGILGTAGGAAARAGRVRAGALAVLQVLAKADSKALHASWTSLLPTSDAVLAASPPPSQHSTLVHVLLHDPVPKVRQAAAVTIATLLEGPAQRAYLGIAECGDSGRQPVRGFLTLSMSLGMMAAVLHSALLQSLRAEGDAAVVLGTLRALGTLLLAAPYHRLAPGLLLRCVQSLQHALQRALPHPEAPPASQEASALAVASLSCLAAAFGTKQPSPDLEEYLCPAGSIGSGSVSGTGSSSSTSTAGGNSSSAVGSSDGGTAEAAEAGSSSSSGLQGGAGLVRLLFACSTCGQPAVELEAVMALRGLAQQYSGAVRAEWCGVLAVASSGAAAAAQQQGVPQSPRSQQDGTLAEKLAHQSIRLAGDFLVATDPHPSSHSSSSSSAAQTSQPPASFSLPAPRQPAGTLSRQARTSPRTAHPLTLSPPHTSAVSAASLGQGSSGAPAEAAMPVPAELVQEHKGRWEALAAAVLRPAVAHGSPLVRSAAHTVVGGLSPGAFGALAPPLQLRLVQWCCAAAARDGSSPVRAAAAKAMGALAGSQCCLDIPNGLELLVTALRSACHDAVLAVRVQAAPALAALCSTLAGWLSERPCARGASRDAIAPPAQQPAVLSLAAAGQALPALLGLATHAARDSEKVRASGVEALGYSFACLGAWLALCDSSSGSGNVALTAKLDPASVSAAGEALAACLQSTIPKVHWSACSAAGQALRGCSAALGAGAAASASGQEGAAGPGDGIAASMGMEHGLVEPLQQVAQGTALQLVGLLGSCPSLRSRSKAAAALRSVPSMAWFRGSYASCLLQPLCEALFVGKASGYQVPGGSGHSEAADPSLKLQLEAELSLALLHLLALAPTVPSAAAGAEQASAFLRVHLQQLHRLLLAALARGQAGSEGQTEGAAAAAACEFELGSGASRLAGPAAAGLARLAGVAAGQEWDGEAVDRLVAQLSAAVL